jgi:hypothetical protein
MDTRALNIRVHLQDSLCKEADRLGISVVQIKSLIADAGIARLQELVEEKIESEKARGKKAK